MNVPVVSHLKLLVNLYNKMNNRFWFYLLFILLYIYCRYCIKINKFLCNIAVAPLVGAWIEIRAESERDIAVAVAPLVGAWTEISAYEPIHNHNMLRYCRISS